MAFIPKPGANRSIRGKYAGGKVSGQALRQTYGRQRAISSDGASVPAQKKGAARSIRAQYGLNVDHETGDPRRRKRETAREAAYKQSEDFPHRAPASRDRYAKDSPPSKKPPAGAPKGPALDVQPSPKGAVSAMAAMEAKLSTVLAMVEASEAARLETQRKFDRYLMKKGTKGELEPRVRTALIGSGEDAEIFFATKPTLSELREAFGALVLGLEDGDDEDADDEEDADEDEDGEG